LSWTETKISNPSRSDFKYPSDFGVLKNCQIPSDSDADSESVTSLIECHQNKDQENASFFCNSTVEL